MLSDEADIVFRAPGRIAEPNGRSCYMRHCQYVLACFHGSLPGDRV